MGREIERERERRGKCSVNNGQYIRLNQYCETEMMLYRHKVNISTLLKTLPSAHHSPLKAIQLTPKYLLTKKISSPA